MAKVSGDSGRQARLRVSLTVIRRYVDAYRVANLTVRFGTLIKILGGVLALVTFIAIADFTQSSVSGLVVGALVGTLTLFIGVLVAAQGQVLKVILDAVRRTTCKKDVPRLNSYLGREEPGDGQADATLDFPVAGQCQR